MNKLFPLILLITSSCSVPTYVTKHGIAVHCEPGVCFPEKEIEVLTDVFIGVSRDSRLAVKTLMEHPPVIIVVDYELACPKEDEPGRMCSGKFVPDNNLILLHKYNQCIGHSALTHELSHYIQVMAMGKAMDDYHDDTEFFWDSCDWGDIECINGAVSPKARNLTIRILCPDTEEEL